MKTRNIKEKERIYLERIKVSKMITFILSAALKDNDENLEKGILTGVFDTFHKEFASGLNNLISCKIIDEDFQ